MRSRVIQPPFMAVSNPLTITTFSPECMGNDILPQANGAFRVADDWSANLLTFIPLVLRTPVVLSQFFWCNGSAVNGSVDIGIYDEPATTLISHAGSTVASGTSQIQVVDVTDILLPAGKRMWLAIGSSGTNRFMNSGGSTAIQNYLGLHQQVGGWSSGLPSSATLATPSVAAGVPLCGLTGGVI